MKFLELIKSDGDDSAHINIEKIESIIVSNEGTDNESVRIFPTCSRAEDYYNSRESFKSFVDRLIKLEEM